jgi:hypothetical protein
MGRTLKSIDAARAGACRAVAVRRHPTSGRLLDGRSYIRIFYHSIE